MSYVVGNGTTNAQTGITDAGLTINSAATLNDTRGCISGYRWSANVANTLTTASTNVYTFASNYDTVGLYLISAHSVNINFSITTLPGSYSGLLLRTFGGGNGNVQISSAFSLSTAHTITKINGNTIAIVSTAADGTRQIVFSMLKLTPTY